MGAPLTAHHQPGAVIFHTGGTSLTTGTLAQRFKPAHLGAPEGEVFATETPEAPAMAPTS